VFHWLTRLISCYIMMSNTQLSCMAALVVALTLTAPTQARWTGNVMVVNLMDNHTMDFLVSPHISRYTSVGTHIVSFFEADPKSHAVCHCRAAPSADGIQVNQPCLT
jgi:hypothetical protein